MEIIEKSPEEITRIRAEIAERYATIFPDVVLEPLWWGRRPENRAAGRFAIVDQNNDYLFNVCTEIYKPVYHELVIHQVEQAAAALPEFGTPVIKFNLLANGGKIKVNVRFPEVELQLKPDDIMNPSADIFSSYDLGWKYKAMFGAYRLVCSNGMTVGEIFDSFRKRHLVSLHPEELTNMLMTGMPKYSEQIGLWKNMAEQKVPQLMFDSIMEDLKFSKGEIEKIVAVKEMGSGLNLTDALKSKDLTMWDLNSVLTQYVTHDVTSELRKIELLPKITAALEHKEAA